MGNQKSSRNSTDRQYNGQRKRDRRQTIADKILHTTPTIKYWATQIPL
jgi:hypothetical protein